ncbi:hypothetical protein ACOSP7_012500 [Xanthoceras sorbifolium]
MQPCSREMQGLNSLLNNNNNASQMTNGHDQSQIHHNVAAAAFDPTAGASQDDFLEQMLSSLPSCSWTDLKSPWVDLNGRDLSDETPPPTHHFDDSMILASKLRQHQISGGSSPAAAAAAKMMLQQQQQILMAARGAMGLPLTLGNGSENDVVDGSSFKSPTNLQGVDNNSVQALYNGFSGSLHGSGSNQPQQFHHGSMQQPQSYASQPATAGTAVNQQAQPQGSGSNGGAPATQPRQRVRARRGQATDPHSIAERLRRERIAERMKALQELVPNANKTDKASMLDEIIDYVKFLQLQVKVLSMSRLGGAAAVAPLVADMSSEGGGGGGDCIQTTTANGGRNPNGAQTSSTNDSLTVTEHQVAKLMEEDMGSAMQYLQGKGLCLMPISLATAISTATCHSRNPLINSNSLNNNPLMQSNGDGPSSPSMSVLTVQSATVGNGVTDGSVKDAASVSKP